MYLSLNYIWIFLPVFVVSISPYMKYVFIGYTYFLPKTIPLLKVDVRNSPPSKGIPSPSVSIPFTHFGNLRSDSSHPFSNHQEIVSPPYHNCRKIIIRPTPNDLCNPSIFTSKPLVNLPTTTSDLILLEIIQLHLWTLPQENNRLSQLPCTFEEYKFFLNTHISPKKVFVDDVSGLSGFPAQTLILSQSENRNSKRLIYRISFSGLERTQN